MRRKAFLLPHALTKNADRLAPPDARLRSVNLLGGLLLGAVFLSCPLLSCSAGDPASRGSSGDPSAPSDQNDQPNDGDPAPGATDGPDPDGTNGPDNPIPVGPGNEPGVGPDDPVGPDGMPNEPATPAPVPVKPGAGPGIIEECEPGTPIDVARTPLRRISRAEFNNAVRDLFGDASEPARDGTFPADEAVGSFISNSATLLTVANNEQLLNTSETVAQNVVANVGSATGCVSASDTACIESFLSATAQRAFRGAWDAQADAAVLGIYASASADLGAEMGVETAIEAILLDPRFLYMMEFGTEAGAVAQLGGREVAGRLAAFLWRSVPTTELLATADGGGLDTSAGIEQIAATMLDDPRAQPMLEDFAAQWLLLGRISAVTSADAAFTPAIRDSMRQETFDTFATAAASGTLESLLTAEASPPAELAAFYGPGTRPGVLANGSFLAGNPGPVKRGRVVRQQIMCDVIPEPPAGVEDLIESDSATTTNDLFRQHAEDSSCWQCHQFMDPVGTAFSFYDSLGRYAETENGIQLSSAGEFFKGSHSTLTGTFTGVSEMAGMLAADEFTHKCFTTQMVRFALGRNEQEQDACSLGSVFARFTASNLSIQELLVSVAGSDVFRHRNIVHAGEACE